MDVGRMLRRAQEVEELAGDIYLLLAQRSTAEPALAAVFRRLEREEREHAKRLQMLGSMYLKDPGAFRSAQLQIDDLDAVVEEARSFFEAVRSGVLDVGGATARMVDLEERFAVTHAEVVARSADPGVKALFMMLASQDREHIRLLRARAVAAP